MRLSTAALACVCSCSALTRECPAAPRVVKVVGSIQQAIDSVPADNRERVVIEIPDGVYNERFRLDQNRVTLRGASRDGVRVEFSYPRSEYDRRPDRLGPGVVNLFGDDCVLENLSITNTQPSGEHAFSIYGQPNRLILDNCNVRGVGGDTVSLWNTSFGMYYHRNCSFQGRVDFVCPRGWCFVRDSQFEEVDRTAALWHDGHMDPRMKYVLRNCQFTGVQDWWLGRNHYPSQFYLLDCTFSESMADKPIGTVVDLQTFPAAMHPLFDRRYYFNCHREGGDFAWHADNLQAAAGAPTPAEITPAWTFDGRWDPERDAAPGIESVEVADSGEIVVQFSEPVAGLAGAAVARVDGSRAEYARGSGTRRATFVGGAEGSPPHRFVPAAVDAAYGATATLAMRYVTEQDLPPGGPLKSLTLLTVGDSTVADYAENSPLQGWGWGLRRFVDERVTVVNGAKNGRSSKSFRAEGLWDTARRSNPDLVLIQFGHNDNPGKGPVRETDPAAGGDFRANLRRYVDEARAAGATPVLLTPPARRHFDESGRIAADANAAYAEAARAVAAEAECPLVDLARLSTDLFNNLGAATSDALQVPGDRTHFNPTGARRLAALVLGELQQQLPELRTFVDQERLTRP
ncbi:MAG: hypothetical protein KF847_15830 [Pirellulales bacterium]|nr:hypothetical protein [Pirellulales bacterium]